MAYQGITHTVGDIASAMKRQFGDESGVQLVDSDIFRWVNQGQVDMARRLKLFKATKTTAIVVGTATYPVPSDVLFVQQMLVNGLPVEYRSFEEAQEYITANDPSSLQTGQPAVWYEWGGQYTLYPVPDSTLLGTNITIYYIESPPSVSALTDALFIPDTHYNQLLQYCMAQAHEMDEDWTAAQYKLQQYETSVQQDPADGDRINIGSYPRITVLAEDM